MNVIRTLFVIILSVVSAFTLFSGISHSGIYESKHDLSASGGSANFQFATAEVCIFCHTPHAANDEVRRKTLVMKESATGYLNTTSATGGGTLLLWNRALSNAADSGVGGQGYSTYTSSTMQANTDSVRVYSLLCLSCHDGVGAINVMMHYNLKPGEDVDPPLNGFPDPTMGADQIGDVANEGINIGERVPGSDTGLVNLSNDHPVSFDYTTALSGVDQGLVAPSFGYVANPAVRLFANPNGDLVSMECSTCHDPHDQGGGPSSDRYPFLVLPKSNSTLCLNCHLK